MAITSMVWTHHYIISVLLLVCAISHFYTYLQGYYPPSWGKVLAVLQICWLAASYFTNEALLTLGMIFPVVAFLYIGKNQRKQQEQNEAIIRNHEQQLALMDELRKQRHDFKAHATALMYGTGHDDYKTELQKHFADVDQFLKNESNIIAGTLYSYHKKAEQQGIKLDYNIQHAISGMPLSEYELVSLIGNILDNAMDAACEYKDTGKQGNIFFSCRKQSGIWILVCQNSTVPLQNETIECIFTKRSQSTKGGTHEGIGTQQIMNIVKKHDGTLDFTAIDETFTLKIKIPDVK
ncbi:sensor histidine kinase [Lederbergia graminis]|uniref:sensor histidine kinase n=1 Tax=Lederbergia graminis TaxID=735518 RepID=UPI0036D2B8C3